MIFLALILLIVPCSVTALLKAKFSREKTLKRASEYIIRRIITLEEATDDDDSLKAPKVNIEGPPIDLSISFEKYMNIVISYEMPADSVWEIDRERWV